MALSANTDWRTGRTVLQCNKYMLEHQVECDVTLAVGREKIKAHKYMLISRSAVFHSKLTSQRTLMEINIPDIEPDIIRKMLMFIYTDDVEFDNRSTMKLFQAASKFKIEDLKKTCFSKMQAELSRENVCHVLKMAYDVGNNDVKNSALDYFYRYAYDLLETEGILELPQSCLIDIMKSDKLRVSEEKKYEVAVVWAESKCRQQQKEVNDTNLKALLAPVVNCIKFEEMSLGYFTKNVSNRGILEQNQIISVFQKLVSNSQPSHSAPAGRAGNVGQSAPLALERSVSAHEADSTSTSENLSRSVLTSSESLPQMETDPASSSEHVLATGRQGPTPIPPRGNNHLNNNRAQPARRQSAELPTGAQPLPNDFRDEMGRITIWRFGGILSGKAYLRDNPDSISIIPSHSGKLHGVWLYGSHQRQATYKVDMKIKEDGTVKKSIPNKEIVSDGREKVHLLKIEPPMKFEADNVYTIEMVMKGPTSYYGRTGKEVVTVDDVSFTFIPDENGINGTNTEIGQFPGFVFEKTEL
ncbi:serine-enriched protein-like [Saccostrea echinata]|uniref:serine-enriched protein-like n=1 Tax=Saccostrea echinata TaxID=191078 RepID=UPI002A803704|nr:serine-enriched protein-like [Saccostrea echinata]